MVTVVAHKDFIRVKFLGVKEFSRAGVSLIYIILQVGSSVKAILPNGILIYLFVQRIMNSHVHESTGMTPQQLLMPSLKMDQRIFVTNPELTGNSVSTYAKELFQLQEIAIAVAQEANTISARSKPCPFYLKH